MRKYAYGSLWNFYKIDIDFELHEASILIIIQETGFGNIGKGEKTYGLSW